MSLTTRCPACGTVFRVVPDQLKVSEGWVRCGQCSELFDARLTLSPQVPVVSEVVSEVVAEPAAAAPSEVAVSEVAAAAEPAPAVPDAPMNEPVLAVDFPPEDAALITGAREPAFIEDPVIEPPAEGVAMDSPLDPDPALGAAATEAAVDAVDAAAERAQAEEDRQAVDQVSFMRRARRQAFWRKPWVRGVLAGLALLLTLTLGGQVAYEQRDELAQRVPALQPLLLAMCQPLQCRVGPPRRIEAITIDTSAFARLQPDAFRLQLTLANAADLAVALPALELTLTDNQDQAVIRRVLQAADLGPEAPAALPAQGEWATSVTLTVSPAAAGAITGYRLLAFYP